MPKREDITISDLPYREWARQMGYPHCEVLDWTSSSGDWSFIVSRRGKTWYVMTQENRAFRGGGMECHIDLERPYKGTSDEVLAQIAEEDEMR